jgi:hypothetical protein
MQNILDKNLYVAERISALFDEQHENARCAIAGGVISASPADFKEISSPWVLAECISFLESDKCLVRKDEKDDPAVKIEVRPRQLKRFIKTATSATLGIKKERDKKDVVGLLDRLIKSKKTTIDDLTQDPVENKDLEWSYHIAHYSALLSIEDDENTHNEYGKDGEIEEVTDMDHDICVKDLNGLIRLRENLVKGMSAGRDIDSRIEKALALLRDKKWYCVGSGHYLAMMLDKPETIKEQLRKFKVKQYRTCKRCGIRNHFAIAASGKITFKGETKNGAPVKDMHRHA